MALVSGATSGFSPQTEENLRSHLEQDVLYQQDRVPARNVVVGVPDWDGKREHLSLRNFELLIARRVQFKETSPQWQRNRRSHSWQLAWWCRPRGSSFNECERFLGTLLHEVGRPRDEVVAVVADGVRFTI